MKYTVATFQKIWIEEQGLFIRKYVILNKHLSIEEAKKLKFENYGSWTYPETGAN